MRGASPTPSSCVTTESAFTARARRRSSTVRESHSAAASGRSWERALRAFALHPLVDSVARARALLDAYVAADPMLAQLLR